MSSSDIDHAVKDVLGGRYVSFFSNPHPDLGIEDEHGDAVSTGHEGDHIRSITGIAWNKER